MPCVPTDRWSWPSTGHEHSAQTLRWGVDEAVRRRASLLLVRAVDDAWQVTAWSWYPVVGSSDVDTEAKAYLEDLATPARGAPPRCARRDPGDARSGGAVPA